MLSSVMREVEENAERQQNAQQNSLGPIRLDIMLDFLHGELGKDTNLADVIKYPPCDTYLFAKAALGIYFDEEDRTLLSFLEHLKNTFPSNSSTKLRWHFVEKNVRRWMYDEDKNYPHNPHRIWPRLAVAEGCLLRHKKLKEERKEEERKVVRKGKKRALE